MTKPMFPSCIPWTTFAPTKIQSMLPAKMYPPIRAHQPPTISSLFMYKVIRGRYGNKICVEGNATCNFTWSENSVLRYARHLHDNDR